MTKKETLLSDIEKIKKGINSPSLEEKFKVSLREVLKQKEKELAELKEEAPATKKAPETKKASAPAPAKKEESGKKSAKDVLENCREILRKHNKEKASAKKRLEQRKKQGKPATLTPSETVSKTAKQVKTKVIEMKDKGLSSGEVDKLANGIVATIKSTLQGIKNNAEKHQFLNEIKREISKLDGSLMKVAMDGGMFADGGKINNGEVRRINGVDYLFSEEILNNVGDVKAWATYKVVYDIKDGEKHINYERTKKPYNYKYFTNQQALASGKRVSGEYFADGGVVMSYEEFKKLPIIYGDARRYPFGMMYAPYIKKDNQVIASIGGHEVDTDEKNNNKEYTYKTLYNDYLSHHKKYELGGGLDLLGDTGGANMQSVGGTLFSSADLTSHLDMNANPMFKRGGYMADGGVSDEMNQNLKIGDIIKFLDSTSDEAKATMKYANQFTDYVNEPYFYVGAIFNNTKYNNEPSIGLLTSGGGILRVAFPIRLFKKIGHFDNFDIEKTTEKSLMEDSLSEFEDLMLRYSNYADGGEVDKNGMIYALQNHISSGFIASHTDAESYIEVGRIRRNAMEILRKEGDMPYSVENLVKLLQRAEKMYDTDKMAEGGLAEYYEKKKYKYEEGGFVDENTEMLMSQVKEIRHHADEIQNLIDNNTRVEAWVVAKAERSATDLSDITHYIDGKKENFADGGVIKWQDVNVGDSANVKAENKTGVIIQAYGRKFHLKFVDGSEKTYDASELEFFKDDEGELFADGGRFNTGRAWTLDHYQHNKDEKYEVPSKDRKYAGGGKISYEIEYRDSEGDTFSDSFDTLEEARQEMKKLRDEGYRITETWKYENNEKGEGTFLGRFADGGSVNKNLFIGDILEFDGKKYQAVIGSEGWVNFKDLATKTLITPINSFWEVLYNEGLVVKSFKDIFAQGGLNEHGLEVGDKIIGESEFNQNAIQVMNDGKWSLVDLEKGERMEGVYAKGGRSKTIYDRYQVISDDLYTENPSGSYLFVDTQKDKILGIFDTKEQAKFFQHLYLHELKYGNHSGDELPKKITQNLAEQVYENYADGGMMGNGGELTYGNLKIGEEYYQVTRPDLGIEKIKITKKENGTYSYVSDNFDRETYVTKYQGKYQENEKLFGIYSDKNLAKKKAHSLLEEEMSKYAHGGETDDSKKKELKDILKKDYETFVKLLGENIQDPKFRDTVVELAKDNKLNYKVIDVECEKSKPTQNEISLQKSLLFPLTSPTDAEKYLNPKEPIRIRGNTILTCDNGKYIIDGHHRWSQVFVLNPKAKMVCTDFYELKKPFEGLKATQLGISANLGYLPSGSVKDANLLKVSEKYLKKYVTENITDEVREVFKKNGINNPEEHIWKNVKQLKTKNKPIKGATERDFMPQTDLAQDFQKYTPNVSKLKKGGKATFDDKVKAIKEKLLKNKKVSPSVQKDYGKTYDRKEALESAKRIAGAMRKKEMIKKKLKTKTDGYQNLDTIDFDKDADMVVDNA